MALPLKVHGFNERFSLALLKLFLPALFHAKEHYIVFLNVFLVNNINQAVGRVGLEGLAGRELDSQGFHIKFVLG